MATVADETVKVVTVAVETVKVVAVDDVATEAEVPVVEAVAATGWLVVAAAAK